MSSIRSFVRQVAATALVMAAAAVPAHAVVIETGSYANAGIGSEFDSMFDNFVITGDTVTLTTSTAPMSVTLGSYSFEVGPNCHGCSLTPSFNALFDVTVDGMTKQADLPYSWRSTGPTDYLTFSTPASLLFDFGGRLVRIDFDSLGALASSGETLHGSFGASVTVTPVPEPSSCAMMLAGFGSIAFVARRRRARSVRQA